MPLLLSLKGKPFHMRQDTWASHLTSPTSPTPPSAHIPIPSTLPAGKTTPTPYPLPHPAVCSASQAHPCFSQAVSPGAFWPSFCCHICHMVIISSPLSHMLWGLCDPFSAITAPSSAVGLEIQNHKLPEIHSFTAHAQGN